MKQAIFAICPGVKNDGIAEHSMRDFCLSCAPFWEEYPICPTHQGKLSITGFCKECRKHYSIKNKGGV